MTTSNFLSQFRQFHCLFTKHKFYMGPAKTTTTTKTTGLVKEPADPCLQTAARSGREWWRASGYFTEIK